MNLGNLFNYGNNSAETDQKALQFLPEWSADKWRRLFVYTQRRHFKKGDDIVSIGEEDNAMFLILEGQLEILIPNKRGKKLKRTQVREAGSIVGEQAFLEHKPRTATVRGTTDGTILQITSESFEALSVREPLLAQEFLLDLARIVSVKLRQANQLLSRFL